jgi:hypothetical protein
MLCCYIPVLLLNREFEKQGIRGNFFSVIAEKSRTAGWIICIALSGVLFFFALITLGKLEFYIVNTSMRDTDSFAIIFIVSIAVVYCVYKGLQPIARLGSISLILYMAVIFAAVIVLSGKLKLDFLYPDLFDNPNGLLKGISGEVGKNAEVFIFAILTDKINEKPNKTILFYIPFSLLVVALLSFLNITLLGPYLNAVSFPNYMISSMLDITIFERLDGVDTAIWTVSAVIKIALLYICAESMLEKLTNSKLAKNIAMITVGIGSVIVTISSHRHHFIIMSYSFAFEITAILLFLIIAPIAALVITKKRRLTICN